jgi:hypothetical protein
MENPKKYKGIEYVQLNDLPVDQQTMLKSSLNRDLFIKILVNGSLYQDCILYKDYQSWFEEIYKKNIAEDVNNVIGAQARLLEAVPVPKARPAD